MRSLPFLLDVMVAVAWVMFGWNVFATVASRKYTQMYVSIWYVDGNHPLDGLRLHPGQFWSDVCHRRQPGQSQLDVRSQRGGSHLHTGRIWRWPTTTFPSPAIMPLYSHKLSMIGFWSLAFIYVWTGAHHMIHGPISQWLQTIAIFFSVMLLIPVWTVVYNFFATMKGEWHQASNERCLSSFSCPVWCSIC